MFMCFFCAAGYSNLLCHVFIEDHWQFTTHTVETINVTISSDASVSQNNLASFQEVRSWFSLTRVFSAQAFSVVNACTVLLHFVLMQVINGSLVSPTAGVATSMSGNQLTLSNVLLEATFPARIFVMPYSLV